MIAVMEAMRLNHNARANIVSAQNRNSAAAMENVFQAGGVVIMKMIVAIIQMN